MVFILLCFSFLFPCQDPIIVPFPAVEEAQLPTSLADESIIYDVGDAILLPPEIILDESISLFNTIFGTPTNYNTSSRIFNFSPQPHRDRLFLTMLENAIHKEQRYFANFDDTHFYAYDSKFEYIDNEKLIDDQKRLLYDVFKDTYLMKYRLKVDSRVKDEVFNLTDWYDTDFIILPPLVAGYLYYRGLDKDFSIDGTYFKISLESFHKWSREENVTIGAGIEWAPHKYSPIKIMAAIGLEDGDVELQFIGIGTDLGTVKKILFLQRPIEDVESYRR